jgi:hypothetical protein
LSEGVNSRGQWRGVGEGFKMTGADRIKVKIEEENRVDEEFASCDEAG